MTFRFEQSLQTVNSMFLSRGYTTTATEKPTESSIYIHKQIAEYCNPRTQKLEKVVCYWIPFSTCRQSSAIGKSDVHKLLTETPNTTHMMIICDSISFQATSYLSTLPIYWEALSYEDLACPKDHHRLVLIYSIMTKKDILEVEKIYGPRSGFNKMIAKADAMARYLDFREGDVVKVSKRFSTGGDIATYRILVSDNSIM